MRQTANKLRKLFMVYPILAQVQRERHEYQQAIRALCERAASERNRESLTELVPLIAGPEQDYYSAILRFGCLPAELDQLDVSEVLRPRFTLSRGITRWKQGDMDGARGLIKEASALAAKMNDAFVFVDASIARAILLGNECKHNTALELMDSVLPIARRLATVFPVALPHLYNTAAVELLAVNRPEEAARCSGQAIASPVKTRFPNWTQTAAEIAERSDPPDRLYFSVRALSPAPELSEPAQIKQESQEALPSNVIFLDRFRAQKETSSGKGTMDKPINTANESEARRREQDQIDILALALQSRIDDLRYEAIPNQALYAAQSVLNVDNMTEEESGEIITCVNNLRRETKIEVIGE